MDIFLTEHLDSYESIVILIKDEMKCYYVMLCYINRTPHMTMLAQTQREEFK